MTLDTITLLAVAGSMLAIKLAIIILAVVLLAKALSPRRSCHAHLPAAAALP